MKLSRKQSRKHTEGKPPSDPTGETPWLRPEYYRTASAQVSPQENITFDVVPATDATDVPVTKDKAEEREDPGGVVSVAEETKEKKEDPDSDNEKEKEKEREKPPSEIPIDNINLCFVGGVSTGKSTILNAIFCEQLTQCKIKRTTMVPTVYVENENDYPHLTPPETIFHTIEEKNDELIQKSEGYSILNKGNATDYSELMFNVGKLDINILDKSYVNVYDIPGLNDARTKEIYYQYLQDNFAKFNLVILLVDIHSGLNTSDEIDIVNFITKNTVDQKETHQKKIYTLVVVNKADDMQLVDEEGDELEMTGQMREMFEQSDTLIHKMFQERNVSDQLVGVIPLCAIDAYLYRMVKKHGDRFKLTPEQILKIGVNDEGKKFSKLKPATQEKKVNTILSNQTFIHDMIKLSGFRRFESILHDFLHKNNTGKEIRINNLLDELKKHESIQDCFARLSVAPLVEGFRQGGKILEPGFVDKATEECRRTINRSIYRWLDPLKHTVENHLATLHKIRKIDTARYVAKVQEFYLEFDTLLQQFVKKQMSNTQRMASYVYLYTKIHSYLVQPLFRDFPDLEEYPSYFTNVVSCLYDTHIKHASRVSIVSLITVFKKIGLFTLQVMSGFVDKLVKVHVEISENKEGNLPELFTALTELESLQVDLSRFLRCLLTQRYRVKPLRERELIQKQFFFQNFREVYMQTYLSNLFCIREGNRNAALLPSIYIEGLTLDDIHSEENALELFYVKYETRHKKLRLVLDA